MAMPARSSSRTRLTLLACAVCALALAIGAGSAQALLVRTGGFGGYGTGDGQFINPEGVAVSQPTGLVYVADSANGSGGGTPNPRVDAFLASGQFAFTFGWGVADGKAQSEICGVNCQPGIVGSGAGQFSTPVSVAVDNSGGSSRLDVYVGDRGNNLVEKFNVFGGFISTIDGTTTPQGKFQSLAGVAVDQAGDVWTADSGTGNVDEFDPTGKFLQQWSDSLGAPSAIAVDSADGRVYLFQGSSTASFTLTGSGATTVDSGTANALALDPKTGILYVDHGGDVAVYDKTGTQVDSVSLMSSSFSQGLAFGTIAARLYVSSLGLANVTTFAAPSTGTAPLVQGESAASVSTSGATVGAQVFPSGLDTTCQVQYVDQSTYNAGVFASAQSAPCSPADLGSSATALQTPTATLTGLNPGTTYHYRFVATNSKGTTNGADNTFETQGPPVVISQRSSGVTASAATVDARVNPTGLDTTCTFQYVDDHDFQASGYNNAQSSSCSPADLGAGFFDGSGTYPPDAVASLSGLAPGTTYHFRVVATNSAGTTDGPDDTLKTSLSFLVGAGAFGSSGTADGQFFKPVGVAAGSAGVFVADSGNARVERFDANGGFVSAWGWGVADGKSQSEVCTANCQPGIPGPGGGQFKTPASVAVGGGKVYVGDTGSNQVEVFTTAGTFVSVIDGATTPQGHFQGLAGVAVDQAGNLWTADSTTGNVDQFSSSGKFVQQWSDSVGSPTAIAVASTHSSVYLINGGTTTSFTPTGANPTTVDPGSGVALALDPSTGDLYVDHGGDVAIYNANAQNVDNLYSLGLTSNSEGLAFRPGGGNQSRLYVADASNNFVSSWGPRAAGRPFITTVSGAETSSSTAAVSASIVPLGSATTCSLQYVSDASFQTSGYASAASVACAPTDLGSSFGYQRASATLTGLTVGTAYHYRVLATNSAGTTTGGDQTFVHGQPSGDFARFTACPESAVTAAGGGLCVWGQTTGGEVALGHKTVPIVNPILLQGAAIMQNNGSEQWFNAQPASQTLVDPGQPVPGGLDGNPSDTSPGNSITAVTELVGPIHFNSNNVVNQVGTALQLPVKLHLINPTLGPSCYIGSDSDPVVFTLTTGTTSPPGPNAPITGQIGNIGLYDNFDFVVLDGQSLVDNAFSAPAANGCGTGGSLDGVVDAVDGLPSAAGNNTAILNGAAAEALPSSVLASIDG